MKSENFERELPSGYRQAMYINAKKASFGIIFNLIALAVLGLVMAVAFLSLKSKGGASEVISVSPLGLLTVYAVTLSAMIVYIVLHELVHGAAYKMLTGEKLTFGMSWSCAFCGVPTIYTYRRTAIIAVISPFLVFTLIFIPILVLCYIFSPVYYLAMAFVFGLHLGGCSGDLYVMLLLHVKFKDKRTLMRDTGPEQFFYIPE